LSGSADPVPLYINAAARRGRGRATVDRLSSLDGVELRPADHPEALVAGLREAAERKVPRVLVAGGDGTLHQAVAALAGTETSLGIVPTGTGNDLARALGLRLAPFAAAKHALSGVPRRIDVGVVNDRPYLGVAAIGFDGEVLRFIETRLRRLRGPWVYPYAAVRALIRFVPPQLRLDYDGGSFEGPAFLAAVANSSTFGGGMRIAPHASLDDGSLDLVVIRGGRKWALLPLLPRVYAGGHIRHAAVETHRVTQVSIRCTPSLTLHGDGEPMVEVGTASAEVRIWPRALSVVA
jgi:YegS/Rv2252/BmrU family lipid kinase